MGNGKSSAILPAEKLEELLKTTHFQREELTDWYKKFVKDYPAGDINKSQFIELYSKFYSTGNVKKLAGHVFRTFDENRDGNIDFREFICSLSITTRGTIEQKLEWAFHIYDVDGDGVITQTEMLNIFKSVSKMSKLIKENQLTDRRITKLFERMDSNKDGQLSLEEFINGAKKHEELVLILQG